MKTPAKGLHVEENTKADRITRRTSALGHRGATILERHYQRESSISVRGRGGDKELLHNFVVPKIQPSASLKLILGFDSPHAK